MELGIGLGAESVHSRGASPSWLRSVCRDAAGPERSKDPRLCDPGSSRVGASVAEYGAYYFRDEGVITFRGRDQTSFWVGTLFRVGRGAGSDRVDQRTRTANLLVTSQVPRHRHVVDRVDPSEGPRGAAVAADHHLLDQVEQRPEQKSADQQGGEEQR